MIAAPQGKGLDSYGFTVSGARVLELGLRAWYAEVLENVGPPELRVCRITHDSERGPLPGSSDEEPCLFWEGRSIRRPTRVVGSAELLHYGGAVGDLGLHGIALVGPDPKSAHRPRPSLADGPSGA